MKVTKGYQYHVLVVNSYEKFAKGILLLMELKERSGTVVEVQLQRGGESARVITTKEIDDYIKENFGQKFLMKEEINLINIDYRDFKSDVDKEIDKVIEDSEGLHYTAFWE